jgi:hypothetical protein
METGNIPEFEDREVMNSEQVKALDQRIIDLAKYEASMGGMIRPSRQAVNARFIEFKGLVMRQEITIGDLDDMVHRRWGDPGGRVTSKDLGIRNITDEDMKNFPGDEMLN